MKEIWKDIKNYEGIYQVSNKGRVRGIDRITNGKWGTQRTKGVILQPGYSVQRYHLVNLRNNGERLMQRVHRLVCQAFLPNPLNKPTVNHKNGIKDDNRLENLEWATYSENLQHAFDTGLRKHSYTYKPVLMLSLDDEPLLWFDSMIEAGEATNTHRGSISACCRGRNKTAGGYKWEYYKGENND